MILQVYTLNNQGSPFFIAQVEHNKSGEISSTQTGISMLNWTKVPGSYRESFFTSVYYFFGRQTLYNLRMYVHIIISYIYILYNITPYIYIYTFIYVSYINSLYPYTWYPNMYMHICYISSSTRLPSQQKPTCSLRFFRENTKK